MVSRGKKLRSRALAGLLLLVFFVPPVCADVRETESKPPPPSSVGKSMEAGREAAEKKPTVTQHTIRIGGEVIEYEAVTGTLKIADGAGKHTADMFFVAYVKSGVSEPSERPITFAFNGGPGASSIWLHMGGIGPRRAFAGELKPIPPPYDVVDNEYSWLSFTDLVFIDPVGTGYSRAAEGVKAEELWGVQEDIRSVGEFIRLYTTQYGRWLSPKFLAGESYGTLRAAGLAEYLHDEHGMDVNGLILISMAVNFQTFSYDMGNDLPYVLFLPTFAAVASYHNRSEPAVEGRAGLRQALNEAERWAIHEYNAALAQGTSLPKDKRAEIAAQLARFTGLSTEYVEEKNLRIDRQDFMTELLRGENRFVGLTDGRATGVGSPGSFVDDPGVAVTVGPYVAALHDYLRDELNYRNELPYIYLSTEANRHWNYGSASRGYVNLMDSLKTAMTARSYLKVFVASGYYDLDTPYSGAKYTIDHLGLPPDLVKNVSLHNYESGHMIYVSETASERLTADVRQFVKDAVSVPPGRDGG